MIVRHISIHVGISDRTSIRIRVCRAGDMLAGNQGDYFDPPPRHCRLYLLRQPFIIHIDDQRHARPPMHARHQQHIFAGDGLQR